VGIIVDQPRSHWKVYIQIWVVVSPWDARDTRVIFKTASQLLNNPIPEFPELVTKTPTKYLYEQCWSNVRLLDTSQHLLESTRNISPFTCIKTTQKGPAVRWKPDES
jgi:hypothetical protein